MRIISNLMIFCGLFFTVTPVLAQPIVTHDVHIMQQASTFQCRGAWRGTSSPDVTESFTGGGSHYAAQPGVMSCIGCAIDNSSKDCVCRTCYSYY